MSVIVGGNAVTKLPEDLYIPPDAMLVVLEVFEGPLDLLLYLIKKHNLDILDIEVAKVTKQYMAYIDLMRQLHLELVADYLEMAALLTEIKSRMLLPKPADIEEEEDPRAELVRRLQEYEQIKKGAESLDEMPRLGRDIFTSSAAVPDFKNVKPEVEVDLKEVLLAFRDILQKVDLETSHHVEKEPLSVREKMTFILSIVKEDQFVEFKNFFISDEGRQGIIVTFLAILEMVRERFLELVQSEPYAPIYVRGIS